MQGPPRLTILLSAAVLALAAGGCGGDAPAKGPDDVGSALPDSASPVDTSAQDTSGIADIANRADTAAEDGDGTSSSGGCKTVLDCEKKGDAGTCRMWSCNAASGSCIKLATPDGAICEEGGPCRPGICSSGSCHAKLKECPSDGNPCTIDKCDEATGGCVGENAADGAGCDDGKPCTSPDTCKGGTCVPGANVCGCDPKVDPATACPDDDGNPCTGTYYCDASAEDPKEWKCALNPSTVVKCAGTGDPCRLNACDPKTSKCAVTFADSTTSCDDGRSCTTDDVCNHANGKCDGKPGAKCCEKDADCPDDGDLCNGVDYCRKATGNCEPNPASVVYCKTVDDTACRANTCDKKTGGCALEPVGDGKQCDDDDACTSNTECKGGGCVFIDGKSANACKCTSDADCADKDDANLCNGVYYCNKQHLEKGVLDPKCEINPKTVVDCPESNKMCHVMMCDKKTGKCDEIPDKEGASCRDGNPCTVNDSCDQAAQCKAGQNTCECEHDKDCSAFDDGNACNGDLFCDKTTLNEKGQPAPYCRINPKSIVHCSSVDNTSCKQQLCDPKTGTCGPDTERFEGKSCSDGKPCTVNDACKAGKCQPGPNLCECEPNNPKMKCPKYDDGNPCLGQLYCDASKAIYRCRVNDSTVVKCPGLNDNYCRTNTCRKDDGKCGFVYHHVDEPCDDGNKCTTGELCKAGLCAVPGLDLKQPCDDDNPCTKDSCDKANGCLHAALEGAACDDGDACTVGDQCKGKLCRAGAKKNCDDGNPCTTNTCNLKSGCLGFNNSNACDDGDKCTEGDSCVAGVCVKGAPKKCADTQICTLDTCDKGTGACKHDNAPAAKVCDDGLACTTKACNNITGCSYTPTDSKCDDGLPCTIDKCFVARGCLHTPDADKCDKGEPCKLYGCLAGKGCVAASALDGSGCSDGKPCTSPDKCKGGGCVAGPKVPGCEVDPKQCAGKADGTACNTGDKCSTGHCLGGVCRAEIRGLHMRLLAGGGSRDQADGRRQRASFDYPTGVAVGGDGSVYVADTGNHAIRRIDGRGLATTYAGVPLGYHGGGFRDGPALGARFRAPTGLGVDRDGGLWVADRDNHRVRYITPGRDGHRTASTLAGTGKAGFADGKGGAAKFYKPYALAIAPDGRSVYVADSQNHRVRLVRRDGTVTTYAGTGALGMKDGKANAATFGRLAAVAVGPGGDVYVAGYGQDASRRIRHIDPKGNVTTLAGGGAGSKDGKGSGAQFRDIFGLAVDRAGVVWVSTSWNFGRTSRLATVMADGTVTSFFDRTAKASNWQNWWREGPASSLEIGGLYGIAFTPTGDLIGAAQSSQRIAYFELRRSPCDDGDACTLDTCNPSTGTCSKAKEGPCQEGDFPCLTATCAKDTGLCSYKPRPDGSSCEDELPCTPAHNCQLGTCSPAAVVTTLAGYDKGPQGSGAGAWDAPGRAARFRYPNGVDVDPGGKVWVADSSNHMIRRINSAGEVITVAGSFQAGPGFVDGAGTQARFDTPTDVACGAGACYVADFNNHSVRRVAPDGTVTTIAGSKTSGYKDGPAATALFKQPMGVAVDAAGVVYIAEVGNDRIRKRTPAGEVSTLSGGIAGYIDGPASAARFHDPAGMDLLASGDLYVADSGNGAIRRVRPDGWTTTVVGGGNQSFRDGEGALGPRLRAPHDVATDGAGNLFVSDTWNHAIRVVYATGQTRTIAGGPFQGKSHDFKDGKGAEARFYYPKGLALVAGALIVADQYNHRVRRIALPSIACDDGNACTADACANDQGCVHPPVTGACEDGAACTLGDTCAAGACKAGVPAAGCKCKSGSAGGCDDGNACTLDGCDPHKGCTTTPVSDGAACDDGNKCTGGESCRAGQCAAAEKWVVMPYATGRGRRDGDLVPIQGGHRAFFRVDGPSGFRVDADGDIYLADRWTHTIRRIRVSKGYGETIAGAPGKYNAGLRDGPALAAKFNEPVGIALAPGGVVYVTELRNYRVRRIAEGEVTTFAGSSRGYRDGKGKAAKFNDPFGIASDPVGTLFVADQRNCLIRKISPDGTVTTLAGKPGKCASVTGTSTASRFCYPSAVDFGPDGNLYVGTRDSVMRVTTKGRSELIAGNGGNVGACSPGFGDGIAPFGGRFNYAAGLAVGAAGNIFVADRDNYRIRLITAPTRGVRRVMTIAGGSKYGDVTGLGDKARFGSPVGIALLGGGRLMVSDPRNRKLLLLHRVGASCDDANACTIDKCDPKVGCTHTKAPDELACPDGGPCAVGTCDAESGACTYKPKADGSLCGEVGRCDRQCYAGGCHKVGLVTAWVGNGVGSDREGQGAAASIDRPAAAAYNSAGELFVSSFAGERIVKIDPHGKLSFFAGDGVAGADETGPTSKGRFAHPWGLAFDDAGILYVADNYNHRIRRVFKDGSIATFAGLSAGNKEGTGTGARLKSPAGLARGGDGAIYVADSGNYCLRRLDPSTAKVRTWAGQCGKNGWEDGKAEQARFGQILDVSFDAKGVAYVADTGRLNVRRIGPGGIVTTIAGHYIPGLVFGVGRLASSFNAPHAVLPLPDGTLVVTDRAGYNLRRVWMDGRTEVIAGTAKGTGYAAGLGTEARLSGIGLEREPKTGDVLVLDYDHNRILRVNLRLEGCAELRGASRFNAGTSCKAIRPLAKYPDPGSYWIDVDGSGARAPFRTQCDMQSAGGGWTRIDDNTDTEIVGALRGSTGRVMYKCSDAGKGYVVSPPTSAKWQWTLKTKVPGTWLVNGLKVDCGGDASFDKPPCGYGWGCAEPVGGGAPRFVPGITKSGKQCGDTDDAWTSGQMSICKKNDNFKSYRVFMRADK